MNKTEVIEIARMAAPFLGEPDADMVVVLESIVAEVERRTLELAAVVCESYMAQRQLVDAIRSLKENT